MFPILKILHRRMLIDKQKQNNALKEIDVSIGGVSNMCYMFGFMFFVWVINRSSKC